MNLQEANFTLYAAKHYECPYMDTSEFYEDLKRFVYLKRLFNQYAKNANDIKINLIINHVIILYNVFGSSATEMLFLRLDGHESALKTILVYLQRMPERIDKIGIKCKFINNAEIPIDVAIWERLRKL
jgi:hypothetical protein